MNDIDFGELRNLAEKKERYRHQISRLQKAGKQTSSIEEAVTKASDNIARGTRSFVIYGEPQSGKTEMMICLTAKLADQGAKVIIHLLNDSVQLLQQNLERFQRSNLSPAAKNFSDVLDPAYSLKAGHHIIFCKKNGSDLAKLNLKTFNIPGKVIIDDEADFATPNALVNKNDVSPINALINKLIGADGIYIGVTATPARLDLNNTFDNDNELWVNFPPHNAYTGQDVFFPIEREVNYSLRLLPDTDDSPKYLRDAILRFLIRVAAINLNTGDDANFSMLNPGITGTVYTLRNQSKGCLHGPHWPHRHPRLPAPRDATWQPPSADLLRTRRSGALSRSARTALPHCLGRGVGIVSDAEPRPSHC